MQTLVKVDPKEFGLEESKAADIAAQFKPMLDKMVELEKEYNEVIALPIEVKETAIKARDLRLKYVKVRTGTEKIHKEQKAFYLSAGRFVDGWKNTQLFASQGIEKKLEDIEQYAENKRKEQVAALQLEREQLLAQFEVENAATLRLGEMTEDIFSNFLLGTKTAYDNKKEAERLAEEQRLAAIEAEKKRIEEQRIENERLKKEAEEKEALIIKEREIAAKKQKALEDAARIEREAAEIKLAAERAEAARLAKIEAEKAAAALKAEQDAARKLAEELAAKQKAEQQERDRLAKIEAEKLAAAKKAAKAPDKEKMIAFVSGIQLPELPAMATEEGGRVLSEIRSKFTAYITWAQSQINNL